MVEVRAIARRVLADIMMEMSGIMSCGRWPVLVQRDEMSRTHLADTILSCI